MFGCSFAFHTPLNIRTQQVDCSSKKIYVKRSLHLHFHHLHSCRPEPFISAYTFTHTELKMSDQAELLRKRREARQKKILASGESRLSKITGTTGTSAQVAPTPSVLHAREQLMKKEEEEQQQRLRASSISAGNSTAPSPAPSSPTAGIFDNTATPSTAAPKGSLEAPSVDTDRSLKHLRIAVVFTYIYDAFCFHSNSICKLTQDAPRHE